jgi:uncharacterized repeat protein (TIGR03847 family)
MIRTFDSLDRFTVGTVGMPGERTFYIQFRASNTLLSFSLEKSQVAVLSERLRHMVKEIKATNPLLARIEKSKDSLPLDTPIEDEFRVGSMAIFFDSDSEKIQLDLRELNQNSDEEEDDDLFEDGDVEVVRLFITIGQALTFSARSELILGAGRAQCPFCGFPINPTGHICARANGYRR